MSDNMSIVLFSTTVTSLAWIGALLYKVLDMLEDLIEVIKDKNV